MAAVFTDDVMDIAARAVAGVLAPGFNVAPNNLHWRWRNTNDVPPGDVPVRAFARAAATASHRSR